MSPSFCCMWIMRSRGNMTRSLLGTDSARRIETGPVTSDTAEKYQFIKNITHIPHDVR
jgi:hypothetical protein